MIRTLLRRIFPLLFIVVPLVAGEDDNIVCNVEDPEQAPVVREGTTFSTKLTVRNPKDRAMRIDEVNSSCLCSRLELGTTFLLPGQATTFVMEAPTANLSGLQFQRVWFYPSDPTLGSLLVKVYWRVRPMVTVDILPPGQKEVERPGKVDPEKIGFQDLDTSLTQARPDEAKRLRKNILLTSPAPETPEGGLRITKLEYAGELWRFIVNEVPDDPEKVLLLARAAERWGPDTPIPEQVIDEKLIVHTNHPDKSRIELHFWTAIDQRVGSPDFKNPFGKFE